MDLDSEFKEFLADRRYLKNVTEKTITWHQTAWNALFPHLKDPLTQAQLVAAVAALRQKGLQPVSVNTYICSLNTFLRWLFEQEKIPKLLKLPRQKVEQDDLEIFTPAQVEAILNWKPTCRGQKRLYAMVATLIDTGIRLAEACQLTRDSVDFDNLLIRVFGKGRKVRYVPMTVELRKILWRWLQSHHHELVFATSTGTALAPRNAERDIANMGTTLGLKNVRCSPHTFRHTFAVNYLRRGGDVFRLQRILGHSTLEMTRRYARLQTSDLQAVHQQYSMLARRLA